MAPAEVGTEFAIERDLRFVLALKAPLPPPLAPPLTTSPRSDNNFDARNKLPVDRRELVASLGSDARGRSAVCQRRVDDDFFLLLLCPKPAADELSSSSSSCSSPSSPLDDWRAFVVGVGFAVAVPLR